MKIYSWSYKGTSGTIIAPNLKDAKTELARKQGNPKKIKKGTVIEKTGIQKNIKAPKKTEKAVIPVNTKSGTFGKFVPEQPETTQPIPENIEEEWGPITKKEFTVKGPLKCMINGSWLYIGPDTHIAIKPGERFRKLPCP